MFVAADDVDATPERLDADLPDTFRGWPVHYGWDDKPVEHHVEVATVEVWWTRHLGFDVTRDLDVRAWLSMPQQLLFEGTARAVFADSDGVLGRVRERLAWYPHDVWRTSKIAASFVGGAARSGSSPSSAARGTSPCRGAEACG